MGEIPEDLFEALLSQDEVPTPRQLAAIALALRGHDGAEIERCPHCGALLRGRRAGTPRAAPASSINGSPIKQQGRPATRL